MKRNQLRIIGGQWRSRRISFPSAADLRPTPDRVRETLFNWLGPHLDGASCLDCFAGSGILSFEALSRGAAHAVAIENNRQLSELLKKHAAELGTTQLKVIHTNATHWLKKDPRPYDVIFLDPPYRSNQLPICLPLLNAGWCHLNTLVYFESNYPLAEQNIPSSFEIMKEKKAGQVYFYLARALRPEQ